MAEISAFVGVGTTRVTNRSTDKKEANSTRQEFCNYKAIHKIAKSNCADDVEGSDISPGSGRAQGIRGKRV